MVKILATGLSGLVGSRIQELLRPNFDFQNLDLSTGIDILDKKTLEEKVASSQASCLLHLAAFTDVNKAWLERGNKTGLCYRINVLGTKNVVDVCRRYGKYLIYFSTDFVFDGKKEGVYTEEDLPKPIEWYGQTKAWAEEEVEDGLNNYSILRIAFPFRATFINKSDVVRKILDGLINKTLYPIFTDQIITPTFIDEIALAIAKVLELKPQGVYHLVGSTSLSPYELAVKTADLMGITKELIKPALLTDFLKNNPQNRPYQPKLALSNRKIIKELGIKLNSIDEALKLFMQQIRAK